MVEEKPVNKSEESSTIDNEASEEVSFIERAKLLKKELDAAVKEANSRINEFKELKAEDIISGRSSAGQGNNADEEDPVAYAERVLEGRI